MKVLTLNEEGLRMAARRLADDIVGSCPDGFDLMVGIRRGGAFVADGLQEALPDGYCRRRRDVELQRPSTKRKGNRLSAILRRMPIWMLNTLRCVEARMLQLSCRGKSVEEIGLSFDTGSLPSLDGKPRILVVDDAIDSGVTIRVVCDALQERYGMDAVIKTAVVTVTTDAPLLDADFYCYHDHTLVRFPWSMDYKR